MKQNDNSPVRFWSLLWGLGLAGQLCWHVENQWFNTFVYAKIAKDSNIVTAMIIASALVTTFSTFFFGTLSDRMGTRRKFISFGYIGWGLFTIVFGFTEFINSGTVGGNASLIMLAAFLVVLTDCVMSFFGSIGNDAGYNTWTNDMTTDRNRGQIGAALATQPVIGTILGTVLGGLLIGSDDNYQRLFWAMGLFVILMGFVSLLFLRDAPGLTGRREGSFWEQFAAVFNFKQLFKQRELVWSCLIGITYFISFNVFFVHMGNWLIYRMGFTPDLMGLIQGLGLLAAMLLAIPGAGLINRKQTPLVATAGVIITAAGLITVSLFIRPGVGDSSVIFAVGNLPLLLAVFLIGAGYILIMQSVTMWVKQLFPESNRGQFEGVRILSFVLLPMLIGTIIGNIIVRRGAGSIINEFGFVENIPTESMFLWATVLLIPVLLPLIKGSKFYYKRVRGQNR
ncbi:MAG: MFS transporter [Treponema sp.]|nr:MFS transporter [Treponema sp.]